MMFFLPGHDIHGGRLQRRGHGRTAQHERQWPQRPSRRKRWWVAPGRHGLPGWHGAAGRHSLRDRSSHDRTGMPASRRGRLRRRRGRRWRQSKKTERQKYLAQLSLPKAPTRIRPLFVIHWV